MSRVSEGSSRFRILPRNWFLALLAAALGTFVAFGPADLIREREVTPILPEFDALKVGTIQLARPDPSAVDSSGVHRTTLVRGGQGSAGTEDSGEASWRVKELFGAPAFQPRIDQFLARVGSMSTLDLISESPSGLEEYGLTEERALAVTLWGLGQGSSSGAPLGQLLMAPVSGPGVGGGAAIYVKRADDPRVWRVSRFSVPSAEPRSWFDNSGLMPLGNLVIAGLSASGPGIDVEGAGPAIISTRAGGGDQYEDAKGGRLDGRAVADLMSRLRTLFPEDVVGTKEPGERLGEDPWLSLEVAQSVGGKSFRIDFDEPDPGSETVSKAARVDAGIVVTVRAEIVAEIHRALRAVHGRD